MYLKFLAKNKVPLNNIVQPVSPPRFARCLIRPTAAICASFVPPICETHDKYVTIKPNKISFGDIKLTNILLTFFLFFYYMLI